VSRKYSPEDYAFMSNLHAAMHEQTSPKSRLVIYFWLLTVGVFILWAIVTQIDEITRGSGEVVPTGRNQIVQNLEGGIVKAIYVQIGDLVEKGTPLLKIDNSFSESKLASVRIKELELKAKELRLKAEYEGKKFEVSDSEEKLMVLLMKNEKDLYESRQKQFLSGVEVLKEQQNQKENELNETLERIRYLSSSETLISKEVEMMRPMVKEGVKSKITFMQLQREQNKIKQELQSTKLAIPRLEAAISEVKHIIEEKKSEFRNISKEELNKVTAERLRATEEIFGLEDLVLRTEVRSPVTGVIQQLLVNTVGGVIKPGDALVEIVPADELSLWIEVKIKPADIAFIYPNQRAVVKVSAYDFAIYGSLEGSVAHISADTSTDEQENVFYTVHIKTNKNYLGTDEKPLKIIPGMTVDVDIMTGKKSLMDYILKPILKAREYTFTER